MKASDISTEMFLFAIRQCARAPGSWTLRWEVAQVLGYPDKVVLAKARKLIKQGVIGGCACGCRGDWHELIVTPTTEGTHP